VYLCFKIRSMANILTHVELTRLSGDGRWMYKVWIDGQPQPQKGLAFFSAELALEAAQREAKDYVPPPPGIPWEIRLENLKKKLGFIPDNA